jgi:nucleotide-binding universal stress UspA family protein
MTLAEGYRVNLLVVGFIGRKGPKADPTILGSAVDHNLRNGRCPILVIKTPVLRKDTPASSYLWVVLIDGSERSLKAAKFAAGMMEAEYDRMKLRHVVKGGGEPGGLRASIEQEMEGTGINWTLEVADSGDADVQTAVLDYVNEGPDHIHYIVVGVDGSGVGSKARWQVGHVTEAVLRTSKLNVLIYK